MPQLEVKQNSPDSSYGGKSPGTLPDSANNISRYAINLLKRLLEQDPRRRLRSIFTLQQEGLFKDINFAAVKTQKVALKLSIQKWY